MDIASLVTFIDALPLPLLAVSPDGRLLAMSAAASRLLGLGEGLLAREDRPGAGALPGLRFLLARLTTADVATERLRGPEGPLVARAFRAEKLASEPVLLVLLEEPLRDGVDPVLERALALRALVPGIAHEVRGPLSSLSGMAQVLALDARVDPDIREPLAMVQSQVDRVDSLLRTVVDFARGPGGGPELPASIHDVLDRAQALLGHDLRARRIRVERTAEGRPALVGIDADELLLALVMLLRELIEGGACDGHSLRLLARGESSSTLELLVSLPASSTPPRGRAQAFIERLGGTLALEVEPRTGLLTALVGLPVWRDESRPRVSPSGASSARS